MTTRRYTNDETAEAIGRLLSELTPGRTVYTKITHVSRSGMSRSISLYIVGNTGQIEDITWQVARATNSRVDNTHGGIIMGGCGMDMGFAAVYSLSGTLYPDGFKCSGQHRYTPTGKPSKRPCYSNDHSNGKPYSRGMRHRSGGYALHQVWL